MGRAISSEKQPSSIEPAKTLNNQMLQAQQRAIAVRQKASFGNAKSGYEFGGWKSLLDDYAPSSELTTKNTIATDSIKLDSDKDKIARKKIVAKTETILCPSSQPDTDNAMVFGVVEGTIEKPHVAYLERSQPVKEAIQQPTSIKPTDLKPTEMMRIASSCQEKKCLHFDGQDCRLATRIVEQLLTVTDTLPACQIRSQCRWWQQEGKSACLRCPQIVTENYYSSPLLEQVAKPFVDG
jgi:hypothetical protein